MLHVVNPRPAKKPTKESTSFRLDSELLERVREAAWWERQSMTAYIERALADYLERNPPQPPGTTPDA